MLLAHPKQENLGPLLQLPQAEFMQHVTAVVQGNLNLIHLAVNTFLKNGGGRILYVSSASAAHGLGHYGPYVAAKLAMEGIIKTVALEYAAQGVLANSLRLGIFRTSRNETLQQRSGYEAIMQRVIPQGRMGQPQDCEAVFDALLAPNCYVNGAVWDVSGGLPGFRPSQKSSGPTLPNSYV